MIKIRKLVRLRSFGVGPITLKRHLDWEIGYIEIIWSGPNETV